MQAIIVPEPGPPENMCLGQRHLPVCDEQNTLLVQVAYTALNRADTLQRQGLYPPPPDASDILGLELSGIVCEVGPGAEASRFKRGDRVMSLVTGGAYAVYCLVDAATTMAIPDSLPLRLAASIPEAWLTAYQLLHFVGNFQPGDKVLIHAGASSVGLAAIQLVREMGGVPMATASTKKQHLLHKMGVAPQHAIDYTNNPYPSLESAVEAATEGGGVDLVLCCVGAPYFGQNLQALAKGGRLVLYGLMGGSLVPSPLDLRVLMKKMLQVTATTLRGRPREYKARLVERFWTEERRQKFVAGIKNGREKGESFETNVCRTFPWGDAALAHAMMERNENAGKIVLAVTPSLDER